MKRIHLCLLITLMAIPLVPGCKNGGTDSSFNCVDCETEEPIVRSLVITFTINDENPTVPIEIYTHKFNPSDTTAPDTLIMAKASPLKVDMLTNIYYSAKATYKKGSTTYFAVDGSIFDRQKQTGCENVCWQVIGGKLDVRLKDY